MEQENKNDGVRYLTVLVEKMGDDIKLLAEGQSDLNRKFDEMNGRMDRMESDVSDLKMDVSILKSDVSELKSDVSILKSDVSELKSDVSILKSDVSELKSDVSVLKSDVSELKSDVYILKSDVSELKSDVSDLKSGQTQSLDYLFRIEEEIQSVRKELEENYEKKGNDPAWRKKIEDKVEELERALGINDLHGAGTVNDKKKSE